MTDKHYYDVDCHKPGAKGLLIRRGKRPYCEFYLFGRWNQVGWITGGRFEIDVMKMRA